MFKLTNQIALVTGGANGIGKGIAAALAQAGAKVIIGDIDDTRGKETARELNGDFIELDVKQHDQVKDVVDQIVAKYERIDILASNTGVYPQIDIESLTEADWDYIQNINLKVCFCNTSCVKSNESTALWSCHHYFFCYWANYWLPWLGALWCL